MQSKSSRFPFSEATVRDLKPPATGRAWSYDTKVPGLCVCRTAAGATSFYFYKWHDGKPMRVLLGKYPKVTVKQAQDAAKTMIGAIARQGPASRRAQQARRADVKGTARPLDDLRHRPQEGPQRGRRQAEL